MNGTLYTINTGVSDTYVHNWTEVSALKEFLQNLVFAKNQLGDATDIRREDNLNIIENIPSGFTKADLLIGQSKQRNIEGSPGYFGEGMILALLIFARNNKHIEIQTNGFKVVPRLQEFEHDPSVRTLVLDVTDIPEHEGTIVKVESSEEDLLEAMENFLTLQDDGNVLNVSAPLILPNTSGVYVNGVMIVKDESVRGYNLTDRKLINRDRSSIDRIALNDEISNILASTAVTLEAATEIVARVFKTGDVLEATTPPNYKVMSGSVADIWKRAIEKYMDAKFENIFIRYSEATDREARYRRKVIITPPNWGWELFCRLLGIATSEVVGSGSPIYAASPKSGNPEDGNNLGRAKRLVKMYYGDYGKVQMVSDLCDSTGNKCNGIYYADKDLILIDVSLITDANQLFVTLLHETIHRISGAKDNTVEFTREWEKAVIGVMTKKAVYPPKKK